LPVAPVREESYPFYCLPVVRHDDAGVAGRAQILRRVEAETAHVSEAARALAVDFRPVGLCGVFDDR
jgi:hypothetical protein